MVEETVEEMARTKGRKVQGAATYKTSFNSEWASKWPFITVGSTSSYYWCSICHQENSCAHQVVLDAGADWPSGIPGESPVGRQGWDGPKYRPLPSPTGPLYVTAGTLNYFPYYSEH